MSEYLLTFCKVLTKRQEQIIKETIKIIDKEGIQKLTIKNLSSSLQLSEAAIYRHFRSKIDILCAVLGTFYSRLESSFNIIEDLDITGVEKIKMMFSNHVETFVSDPAIVSILFAEEIFKSEKRLLDKINSIIELNKDFVTDIIKEAQIIGEIRSDIDYDDMSIMVMGSFRFMIKSWGMSGRNFDLRQRQKRLFISIEIFLLN